MSSKPKWWAWRAFSILAIFIVLIRYTTRRLLYACMYRTYVSCINARALVHYQFASQSSDERMIWAEQYRAVHDHKIKWYFLWQWTLKLSMTVWCKLVSTNVLSATSLLSIRIARQGSLDQQNGYRSMCVCACVCSVHIYIRMERFKVEQSLILNCASLPLIMPLGPFSIHRMVVCSSYILGSLFFLFNLIVCFHLKLGYK